MTEPLHAEISGPVDRPAVVLVHPLGASTRFWDAQVAALSRVFRVLRLDLPGHGDSGWAGGELGLDDLARRIIDAIDRQGLNQVHYCGLSIGGMAGMEIALRHGQRLHSLTLSNCLPHLGQPQLWEDRSRAALAGKLHELVGFSMPRWLSAGYLQKEPETAAKLLRIAVSTNPGAYAAFCRLLGSVDLRNDLAQITVPTMVIAGIQDAATPAAACEAMSAGIPHARFVALAGAHFCNLECPEAYSATLIRFFQDVGTGEHRL